MPSLSLHTKRSPAMSHFTLTFASPAKYPTIAAADLSARFPKRIEVAPKPGRPVEQRVQPSMRWISRHRRRVGRLVAGTFGGNLRETSKYRVHTFWQQWDMPKWDGDQETDDGEYRPVYSPHRLAPRSGEGEKRKWEILGILRGPSVPPVDLIFLVSVDSSCSSGRCSVNSPCRGWQWICSASQAFWYEDKSPCALARGNRRPPGPTRVHAVDRLADQRTNMATLLYTQNRPSPTFSTIDLFILFATSPVPSGPPSPHGSNSTTASKVIVISGCIAFINSTALMSASHPTLSRSIPTAVFTTSTATVSVSKRPISTTPSPRSRECTTPTMPSTRPCMDASVVS